MTTCSVTVNGMVHALDAPDSTPLLWLLRGPVGDPSPRYGCGAEQCGACCVLVDGHPRLSCGVPLADVDGREVTTLRGLCRAGDRAAEAVAGALLDRNAGQCGYCLPGIAVTLVHLLRRGDRLDRAGVAAALDGHLCRCGAQPRILDAAVDAMGRWHDGR